MNKMRGLIRGLAAVILLTFYLQLNAQTLMGPNPSAGYRGGEMLPKSGEVIDLQKKYGVIPNDGKDDTAGIQTAINDQKGKFAQTGKHIILQLPAGEINIRGAKAGFLEEGQLFLHVDGVILRGKGSHPVTGTRIVYKHPEPLYKVKEFKPAIDGKIWPGLAVFRVETREFFTKDDPIAGSVNFHWNSGMRVHPNGGGLKGDTKIRLMESEVKRFKKGDLIWVGAVNTKKLLIELNVPEHYQRCENTFGRTDFFTVTKVDLANGYVHIDKPLEWDLPYSEGGKVFAQETFSKVIRPVMVREIGLEDFSFVHSLEGTPYAKYNNRVYDPVMNRYGVNYQYINAAPEYAIHAILFKWARDFWVKNVKIEISGSHPLVTENAINGTFRNNIVEGSWNKGKGGHGYFRGSKVYDTLFENNYLSGVRHFTVQWSASRNVYRYNVHNGAGDLNLHAGYERQNWFEHNFVELNYFHRSWIDPVQGPGNQTWYPIWFGSSLHATKWAGLPTGPDNVFLNNVLLKQREPQGPMLKWGVSDTPGIEYHWGWDGKKFAHPKIKTVLMSTHGSWVLTDFSKAPNSGVFTKGMAFQDRKAPELKISPVKGTIGKGFTLAGSCREEVACKVEYSINSRDFRHAYGTVNWQAHLGADDFREGENYVAVRAVEGENNSFTRGMRIEKKSGLIAKAQEVPVIPVGQNVLYRDLSDGSSQNIIKLRLFNADNAVHKISLAPPSAVPSGVKVKIAEGSATLKPQNYGELKIFIKATKAVSQAARKEPTLVTDLSFTMKSGQKSWPLMLRYYPQSQSKVEHPMVLASPADFKKLKMNSTKSANAMIMTGLKAHFEKNKVKKLSSAQGRIQSGRPDAALQAHAAAAYQAELAAMLFSLTGSGTYAQEGLKILDHYSTLIMKLKRTDSEGRMGHLALQEGGYLSDRLSFDIRIIIRLLTAYDMLYDRVSNEKKTQFRLMLDKYAGQILSVRKHPELEHLVLNTGLGIIGMVMNSPDYIHQALFMDQEGLLSVQLGELFDKDGFIKNGSPSDHMEALKYMSLLFATADRSYQKLFTAKNLKLFKAILARAGDDFLVPGFNNSHLLYLNSEENMLPFALAWQSSGDKSLLPLLQSKGKGTFSSLLTMDSAAKANDSGTAVPLKNPKDMLVLKNGRKGPRASSAYIKTDAGEHFDHLHVSISAGGHPVLLDAGRAMDLDIKTIDYFPATFAHNTLAVDMVNHTLTPDTGRGYEGLSPVFSAVSLDKIIGTDKKDRKLMLKRNFFQLDGDFYFDIVAAYTADKLSTRHKFDLVYHFNGDPQYKNPDKLAKPRKYIYEEHRTYRQLNDVEVYLAKADIDFVADFAVSETRKTRLWHKAAKGLKVMAGRTPYADTSGLTAKTGASTLILRHEGESCRFVSLLNPYIKDVQDSRISRLVTVENEAKQELYQIIKKDQADLFLALPKDSFSHQGMTFSGKACYIKSRNGVLEQAAVIGGDTVICKNTRIELKKPGNLAAWFQDDSFYLKNMGEEKIALKVSGLPGSKADIKIKLEAGQTQKF